MFRRLSVLRLCADGESWTEVHGVQGLIELSDAFLSSELELARALAVNVVPAASASSYFRLRAGLVMLGLLWQQLHAQIFL